MIRLLPAGLYTEMPWKNGLGVTREVARYPESGEYEWRISLATIRQPGPFSTFPGYLRNISVLEGGGMYLTIDGQRSALIALSRRWGSTARAAYPVRLSAARCWILM
jgi:environmental stress-induced protein Ves